MKPILTLILALLVLGVVGAIDSVIESYVPWLDDFVLTWIAAIAIIAFITKHMEK